jgi:hypothetical protein
MTGPIGVEALIPNPALQPFAGLIGEWRSSGTHPLVPGTTFHGRASFAWHQRGAFLVFRSEVDEPEIPSGVAVLGSDADAGTSCLLYFDERGVSRAYVVSIEGGTMTWSRQDPHLAQTMTYQIEADRIVCTGRMSRDGAPWEDDLSLTYERVR